MDIWDIIVAVILVWYIAALGVLIEHDNKEPLNEQSEEDQLTTKIIIWGPFVWLVAGVKYGARKLARLLLENRT